MHGLRERYACGSFCRLDYPASTSRTGDAEEWSFKNPLKSHPRWVNFRLPNQDLFTNDIGKTVGNVVFKGWFKRTGGLLRKLLASAALLFYCIALLPRSEAQTSPGLDKNVDGLVQDEMR